jgi:hypothetical protein
MLMDDDLDLEEICELIDEYPPAIGWPLVWLLFWWII